MIDDETGRILERIIAAFDEEGDASLQLETAVGSARPLVAKWKSILRADTVLVCEGGHPIGRLIYDITDFASADPRNVQPTQNLARDSSGSLSTRCTLCDKRWVRFKARYYVEGEGDFNDSGPGDPPLEAVNLIRQQVAIRFWAKGLGVRDFYAEGEEPVQ